MKVFQPGPGSTIKVTVKNNYVTFKDVDPKVPPQNRDFTLDFNIEAVKSLAKSFYTGQDTAFIDNKGWKVLVQPMNEVELEFTVLNHPEKPRYLLTIGMFTEIK